MTYAAALLARLNAKTSNYGDSGRGGRPGEGNTPETITGALASAAIRSKSIRFGVTLFCLIHWPATAWTPASQHAPRGTPPTPSTRLLETRARLEHWLRVKVSRRWSKPSSQFAKRLSKDPKFWTHVVEQVLDEAMSDNLCWCCKGAARVWVVDDEQGNRVAPHQKTCTVCLGTAHVDRGSQRRAKTLRMRADVFKHDVEPAYKWLLSIIRHFADRADHAINGQLEG